MKDNVIDVYGNIIVALRLNSEKRKIRILEKWKEFHQNSTSLYFYRIKPEINQYKSFITKKSFHWSLVKIEQISRSGRETDCKKVYSWIFIPFEINIQTELLKKFCCQTKSFWWNHSIQELKLII